MAAVQTSGAAPMTFTDVTTANGIDHVFYRAPGGLVPPNPWSAMLPVMSAGAVAEDFNGDGFIDLYVLQGQTEPNLLYINSGTGSFADEAASRGAALSVPAMGATAADYDSDGDVDIAVSCVVPPHYLLENDGTGTFTVAQLLNSPAEFATSPSFGDLRGDGQLDLIIGDWNPVTCRIEGSTTPLTIYRNLGSGPLHLSSQVPTCFCFSPVFADITGDLRADLLLVADFSRTTMHHNRGDGISFTLAGQMSDENGMGTAVGDYDNDGDLDWFVTAIFDPVNPTHPSWGSTGNRLYQNNGDGSFTDVTDQAGVRQGYWGWGAAFADFDLDGDLDLFHVNGWDADNGGAYAIFGEKPAVLFENMGDGTFQEVAVASGADNSSQGRSVSVFDAENDGDLDIFIGNNAETSFDGNEVTSAPGIPALLRNDSATGNHWLKVHASGAPGYHSHGIGSRVYITIGATTQMRELNANTGFLGHGPNRIAHFGLGTATVVDELRVLWPDGSEVILEDVPGDQATTVTSPLAVVTPRIVAPGETVTTFIDPAEVPPGATAEWVVESTTFPNPTSASFTSTGIKVCELRVIDDTTSEVLRVERFTVAVVNPPADVDEDGVPDSWEAANGLDPNDPGDVLLDTDGDGQDAASEFAVGTDPNDPASVFALAVSQSGPGMAELTFATLASRQYAIEESADMIEWIRSPAVPDLIFGIDDIVSLPVAANYGSNFFRVSVQPVDALRLDTDPAIISVPDTGPLTHEAGTPFVDPGATATDLNDGVVALSSSTPVDGLVPGSYVLTYDYTDSFGNVSTQVTVSVDVVDTTPAFIVVPDAGPVYHQSGSPFTDPGATALDVIDGNVTLTSTTAVDGMTAGTYLLTYEFTDSAGNVTEEVTVEVQVIDGPVPVKTVARQWNEENLSAIRIDFPDPPVHARNLFHTSVGMYDAWAAYDTTAVGFVHREAATAGDVAAARNEAVSYAAYRILSHRYQQSVNAPVTQFALDQQMTDLGYATTVTTTAGDSPAAVGNRVASAVIALFTDDGSNEAGGYADTSYSPLNEPMVLELPFELMDEPNHWQPLAFDFALSQNGLIADQVQTFLGSSWGEVTPFAMTRGTGESVYYDPGLPPQLGGAEDAAFKDGNVEVVRFSNLLDPDEAPVRDFSPGAIGNNTLGDNDGTGHPLNPVTNQPYAPNLMSEADFGRVVAEFWADGPQSETPPGHWNKLANEVVASPGFERRLEGAGSPLDPLEWDVMMYFTLNASVHDAAVAAWGCKREYDYVRPISAIRQMCKRGQSTDWADTTTYHPDGIPLEPGLVEVITAASSAPGERHEHLADKVGEIALYCWGGEPNDPETEYTGNAWILGIDWLPYQRDTFVTPAFAGYVSGHSTFSRAAAEVLTAMTGSEFFPGGIATYTVPAGALEFEAGPSASVTLQWATYYDAADQAGISRLYGGIHVPVDDGPGRIIGSSCGIGAWNKARKYFDGSVLSPPVISVPDAGPLTHEAGTPFTDPGATANDAQDGATALSSSTAVDGLTPGGYVLTYDHTDLDGNAATQVTVTVNVVDTTAPVITVPDAGPLAHEAGTPFVDPGATADDAVDGAVPLTSSTAVDENTPGTYYLTYDYTDAAGNAATQVVVEVEVTDPS